MNQVPTVTPTVPSQNTSTVTIQTNDQEQFQNMLNALAGFRIPKYFISIFIWVIIIYNLFLSNNYYIKWQNSI